jgi:hypothetical protein
MTDLTNPKQAFGDKKVPLALVPPAALVYTALGFWEGAEKYGPYNWRDKAVEAMTYVHACQRHLLAWADGEYACPKSRMPHLGHALACLSILVDAIEHGNLIDNRPPKSHVAELLERFEKGGVLDQNEAARPERKPAPLSPRIGKHLTQLETGGRFAHACPDLDQELPVPEQRTGFTAAELAGASVVQPTIGELVSAPQRPIGVAWETPPDRY